MKNLCSDVPSGQLYIALKNVWNIWIFLKRYHMLQTNLCMNNPDAADN